jgi:hypothetical protein
MWWRKFFCGAAVENQKCVSQISCCTANFTPFSHNRYFKSPFTATFTAEYQSLLPLVAPYALKTPISFPGEAIAFSPSEKR